MIQKEGELPYITLKPTFEAIGKLQNLGNCTFQGIQGVPLENHLTIDGNKIELRFRAPYSSELSRYWMENLPEYQIHSGVEVYTVPQGSSHYEGQLIVGNPDPMDLSIFINELYQDAITDGAPHFWRYVYPVDNMEWLLKINAIPYCDDYGAHTMFSLLCPTIDGHQFYLSIKKIGDDDFYMLIDSSEPILQKDMEHAVAAFITALGIVTGKRYGNYRYAIASDDPEFETILGIGLLRLQKSKFCPYRIYDTRRTNVLEMLQSYDYQQYAIDELSQGSDDVTWFYDEDAMQDDAFAKLANLCYRNNDMMIAASMMLEGSLLCLEYQTPFYHVALETITSALKEDADLKSPPPMDIAEYQVKVLPILMEALNAIPDISDEARQIYAKRIEHNLNSAANQDKLTASFDMFGYKLTGADKKAIKKRNSSFHGHLTTNGKQLSEQREEFLSMSLRLHKLCGILLFKAAGFSGKILNNEVLFGIKEACDRKEHAYIEL